MGDLCLEIDGSDGIQSCIPMVFFRPSGFQEGAVRSSAICWHHGRCLFGSMVKSEAEKWHGIRVLKTSPSGSRLCIDGELAWCFKLQSSGICE
jgi:serine acetyltransferase